MKHFIHTVSVSTVAALAAVAHAHVGYSGRDFGTLSSTLSTISNQAVSSSFGWADATDSDWGDSHRGRFYRFHVDADMVAGQAVSVSVMRNALGTGARGIFLPGFSLYRGLGQLAPEQGGHDASQLSLDSRPAGTEGSLRALASWSIGNDATLDSQGNVSIAARLAYFTYVGHAADGTAANYGDAAGIDGDGVADGFVTASFAGLAAGDYSLWVGGCNYAAQLSETGATFPTYGVTVSVQLVPAPGAVALLAVAGLVGRRRRTGGA